MEPKKAVVVRVTNGLYSQLGTVSDARGGDVSNFVRRAILKELASLSFLSDDKKKALGIETTRC